MQSESTVSDATAPTSNATRDSPDAKVGKDLATLEEQIDLCQSMLKTERDLDSNEALLAIVGFLEACVPRMVELIQAGMQGALGEDVLERCLVVNDRLCRTLEDCDEPDPSKRSCAGPSSGEGEEATAAPAEAAAPAAAAAKPRSENEKEFDDLLLGSNEAAPAPAAAAEGGKTTGEEEGAKAATPADPFAGAPDVLTPTPMGSAPAAPPAAAGTGGKDEFDKEFDDFLKERASGEKNGD